MARRETRKLQPEYSFIGVKLIGSSVAINASLNYEVRDEKRRRDELEVYSYGTHIELNGICTYPETLAGHHYQFSVYSGSRHQIHVTASLMDHRAYDDDCNPVSRKYRGQYVPVYHAPLGIGYLDKQRGKNDWRSAVFVDRQSATDMLVLLRGAVPLFINVHQMRVGRKRWVVGFTLQDTDPSEE